MNPQQFKHAFLIGVYQNPDYTSTLVELLRGGEKEQHLCSYQSSIS